MMINRNRDDFRKTLEAELAAGEITLGQAIQKIRTELYAMTQIEFAAMCRVSDRTVRDVETGRTDPRLSIVERMLNMGGLGLTAKHKVNYVRSANPLEN
jgi:DNA-binding transcriptional regulator YiaG